MSRKRRKRMSRKNRLKKFVLYLLSILSGIVFVASICIIDRGSALSSGLCLVSGVFLVLMFVANIDRILK